METDARVRFEKLEQQLAQLQAVVGSGQLIQSGTDTLVAGTRTVTAPGGLRATSEIIVTIRDPGAGAITDGVGLDAPVATRSVAAGTFVVNSINSTGGTIATAVSTFDWVVLG